MTERDKYEAGVLGDVIAMFPRPGMAIPREPQFYLSDDDRDAEYEAAKIFYQELASFRSAVALSVIPKTGLRGRMLQELLDVMEDYTPDAMRWEASIKESKHG